MISFQSRPGYTSPRQARNTKTTPMIRARVAPLRAPAGVAYTETLRAAQRIYENINENTSGNAISGPDSPNLRFHQKS